MFWDLMVIKVLEFIRKDDLNVPIIMDKEIDIENIKNHTLWVVMTILKTI